MANRDKKKDKKDLYTVSRDKIRARARRHGFPDVVFSNSVEKTKDGSVFSGKVLVAGSKECLAACRTKHGFKRVRGMLYNSFSFPTPSVKDSQ